MVREENVKKTARHLDKYVVYLGDPTLSKSQNRSNQVVKSAKSCKSSKNWFEICIFGSTQLDKFKVV